MRLPLLTRATGGVVAGLVAVMGFFAGTVALSAPAHAADGYTFWGYYHSTDGQWVPADTGGADYTPKNGALEGYHWATTTTDPSRPPRTDVTFDDVCAGTEAGDGQKLVAVVIDYGTEQDAPDGETPKQPEGLCAAVPQDANGQQVLDAVADVRIEKGLTCGINGYPASGCSQQVADAQVPESEELVDLALPAAASPSPTAATDAAADEDAGSDSTPTAADQSDEGDDGANWGLAGVAALVAVVAGAGLFVARRRRS